MDIQWMLDWVAQYGLIALLFAFGFSLVGMPIPNEAIAMVAGGMAAVHLWEPLPAYLVTGLGVTGVMTAEYGVGRICGEWLRRRIGCNRFFQSRWSRTESVLQRYGKATYSMAVFLPILRHFVPLVAGCHRIALRQFAPYAYGAAWLWTSLYFGLGMMIGDAWDVIAQTAQSLSWSSWFLLVPLLIIRLAILSVRKRREAKKMECPITDSR